MFRDWNTKKQRHKKISIVSFALTFAVLFLTFGISFVEAPHEDGVRCTVIVGLPDKLTIDKTYTMRVDSQNKGTQPYDVWAVITIYGPNGQEFTNNDIFINWISYDADGKIVSNFSLGRNLWGSGTSVDFTQVNGHVIKWTGDRTKMNPGVYRRNILYTSILGSAPLGNYRVVADVLGEKSQIEPCHPHTATFCADQFKLHLTGKSNQAKIDVAAFEQYLNKISTQSKIFKFTGTQTQKFQQALSILNPHSNANTETKLKTQLLAIWLNQMADWTTNYKIDNKPANLIIQNTETTLQNHQTNQYQTWNLVCERFNNLP